MKLIHSIAFALSALTLHATNVQLDLEVPADMAGHTFNLYLYYPGDTSPTSMTTFGPSYWNSATERLSLSVLVEQGSWQYVIENQTLGGLGFDAGNYTNSFFSLTSEDFTANGNNLFTFWVYASEQADVFGLLFNAPTNTGDFTAAFPMTGMTGTLTLPDWGIVNLWSDTGIPRSYMSGTGTLVNISQATYLDPSHTWQPLGNYVLPTMPVSIWVGANNAGMQFTLHTLGGSAQSVTVSDQQDGQYVTGQVGLLEVFWVTRDADQRLSSAAVAFSGQENQDWSAEFPDIVPNWVMTPFLIGHEFASHPLKVVHASGVEQWLEPDPVSPLPETISTTVNGVSQNYQVFHFRATVDTTQAWTLVDTTTSADLGQRTTVTDGLDNWVPDVSGTSISVLIPANRNTSDFVLINDLGEEIPWWDSLSQGSWSFLSYGLECTVDYRIGSMNFTNTGGNWRVRDKGTGLEYGVDPNMAGEPLDLSWQLPTSNLSLQLPASRWTHDLWLWSPGRFEKIRPVTMQGLWSFYGSAETFDQTVSFSPFNSFIGTAVYGDNRSSGSTS